MKISKVGFRAYVNHLIMIKDKELTQRLCKEGDSLLVYGFINQKNGTNFCVLGCGEWNDGTILHFLSDFYVLNYKQVERDEVKFHVYDIKDLPIKQKNIIEKIDNQNQCSNQRMIVRNCGILDNFRLSDNPDYILMQDENHKNFDSIMLCKEFVCNMGKGVIVDAHGNPYMDVGDEVYIEVLKYNSLSEKVCIGYKK